MSRIAVALLLAAPAPPLTAEQALRTYRETFSPARSSGCPEQTVGDAIVICGRRLRQPTLPLPIAPEPGEIVRHVGEPTPDAGPCRMCTQPVGISVGIRFDGKVTTKPGAH